MMPLIFPLALYKAPSGVNLYIMASTFAGVIEQYIIRKHIREKDEAEAKGLVPASSKTGGKVKKKKPKRSSDLLISGRSKSPYPVYQSLLRTENFTRKELIAALSVLEQADTRLKTTGQPPRMILEAAIVKITGVQRPRGV
jgi:hypothetical protein